MPIVKIPFLSWTAKAALEIVVPEDTESRFLLRAAVQVAVSNRTDLSGAYLSRADLSGADLSGADLSGADLSGAYLSRADLSGAYLSRADLSGADLSRADLSGAYLSRAYLSGADLSRADLSGAYLSGAYLSRAYLSGADLSRADLSGAYLSGAGKLVGPGVLQIGPIGSRRDYLVAFFAEKGVWVRAGCFYDTLSVFEAAVEKTHGANDHGKHYRVAIELIKSMADPTSRPAEGE